MRALGAPAVPVKNQRVVGKIKAQPFGRLVLQRLNRRIRELFDSAAVYADNMVMMFTPVQFENGRAAFKVVTGDQPGGLELGQHPLHGGKPDILIGIEQSPVDVFSREMVPRLDGQDVQNLDARRRNFKAGFAQILAFHSTPH